MYIFNQLIIWHLVAEHFRKRFVKLYYYMAASKILVLFFCAICKLRTQSWSLSSLKYSVFIQQIPQRNIFWKNCSIKSQDINKLTKMRRVTNMNIRIWIRWITKWSTSFKEIFYCSIKTHTKVGSESRVILLLQVRTTSTYYKYL